MGTLRRHQLAYLSAAAWARLGREQADDDACACVAHWGALGLPVVVTRQPQAGTVPDECVCVGLSAPITWRRRRLGLRVARHEILWFDEFPSAGRIATVLPRPAREPWRRLCAALSETGAAAHVYGSYGWQCLSGMRHVSSGSDVDLWVAVDSEAQADAVAAVLEHAPDGLPRLDGELLFVDGAAVSWREWLAWRRGRSRAVLVRTLERSVLRWAPAPPAWREAA
jgi:phosphoribosyl-dephospho-CoA transferase